MFLDNKIHLCYVDIKDLRQWIKENRLSNQDFTPEKEKWANEINHQPNFFSDTELLLINQDILLLKVLTESQAIFLAKTYQLEYQKICQKLFKSKKNIILVSEKHQKTAKGPEGGQGIVLFKDRESIEKNLFAWLKEISS